MYPEMRRNRQALSNEECMRILEEGSHGVLALSGDDGYPYAVPISYCVVGNKLVFHSAKTGHKIDAIKRCDKASFTVVAQDTILPEKFTTIFKSVIVFGHIHIVEDTETILEDIKALGHKYSPDEGEDRLEAEVQKHWKSLAIIEMTMEHISGKQAIELVAK